MIDDAADVLPTIPPKQPLVADDLDATPEVVARLLDESRRSHVEYMKEARKGKGPTSPAYRAILKALRLRIEAERLDPRRAMPAWDIERATKFDHDIIVDFYRDYLVRN